MMIALYKLSDTMLDELHRNIHWEIEQREARKKEVNVMNNFLFEDHIDGGFFFVQCNTVDEAYEIILEEVASAHPCCDRDTLMMDYDCLGCYTDAQAEAMGYDTY